MIIRLEVDRGFYKANIEISEGEIENIQENIQKKLEQIDLAIRSSSAIWNDREVKRYGLEFTSNGSVRFPINVVSTVDQLLLLTAAGGSKGITFQESSYLLGVQAATIRSRITGKQYSNLFRKIEEARYSLSPKGIQRVGSIIKEGTSNIQDFETEDASP